MTSPRKAEIQASAEDEAVSIQVWMERAIEGKLTTQTSGAADELRIYSSEVRYYFTDGPVRGNCGHRHKSRTTADRCLRRDRRGCEGQGGYSDRSIRLALRDGRIARETGLGFEECAR